MNLSKSKYCNALQCPKILWLDTFKPEVKGEVDNDSVLENGTEVGILAQDLFGPHVVIPFNKDLKVMVEDTKKELEKDNVVICEASFIYENNFCSVDILVKNHNDVSLYEVKSSTEVSDIYIEDASYQAYVLSSLGYNVKKCAVVYLNRYYERHGDLDLKELFKFKYITKEAKEKRPFIEKEIGHINKYMEQTSEPNEEIDMHCFKPYECPFFAYCTRTLPEKNVFTIRKMQLRSKCSLYKKGIYTYEDLLRADINDKFKRQIEFDLYQKEPYINHRNIAKFLDTLSFPLYFLDFETYEQAVPLYDGVRPYTQIPFQYSLHYIAKEGGKLEHKEFLALPNQDSRRSLAERLVKDIPLNVCTLAYNMRFEKGVIRELANLFPDLKDHLMNIHDNIKDLMMPFYNGDYYTKEMEGSYSIKKVLPALFPNDPALDYHNLEGVHNGSEAMNSYANMGNMSKEEQEKLREDLLKYCGLDTYAMVKIWEKLKEVTKELVN